MINQPVSKISKPVAFVGAFLIWWALTNFLFGLLISAKRGAVFDFLHEFEVALWLLTIITIFVLCIMQRVWVAAGVLAEVLITAGVWFVTVLMQSAGTTIDEILFLIVPIPLGFGLFFRF